MTSFDVIRRLRKQTGIRKMGHSGTLDPAATGLLVIGTGDSTKTLSEYLKMDKEYEAEIEFGKISDTYDSDGKISDFPHDKKAAGISEMEAALKNFKGEIMQIPPAFSAKKIKGVPAYKLARKGILVSLEARKVKISKIEILGFAWPFLKVRVSCSSGTYLRSLAHDLGRKLGCGGYLKSLRRTRIGKFRVEDAKPLE